MSFLLVISGATLTGFVIYEGNIPPDPILRLTNFAQRTASAIYLGTFIHGVLLWCLFHYLPLYYESVQSYSVIILRVAIFREIFAVTPA
ncbi:hypothetical protein BDV27DRAFT_157359 [Aspergillus caelatus]|uniref:Uncharacterized protein n=1 Tax=Aspergillus caelatus TaxID=61420 RepID=A0A5N7A525_9EURO|nr:uncharacterized protein BDV27DRAFT_157359 [Aspergillus caelatus]KAE8364967.1 hypothetical protein BDV27DRAFT_157359 [Aspergillus caelatus]